MFHRDNIPTIPSPDCWHLPGGGIEPGETPEQGARRELSEEVTYVPEKLTFFSSFLNSDGHTTYIFVAIVDKKEELLFKKGPDEGQEIRFCTLEEIDNLKLTPGFKIKLHEYRSQIEDLLA